MLPARRSSVLLALLLATAGTATGLTAARAETTPARAESGVVAEGTLLPQRLLERPSAGISGSSRTLLLMQGGVDYDENDEDLHFSVVRRADGEVLRRFRAPQVENAARHRLVGTSLVRVEGQLNDRRVEISDAVTGATVHTLDISGFGLVHGAESWALLARSNGPTTGDNSLHVMRADGSVVDVPGRYHQAPNWVGGDAETAYVTSAEGSFAIDVTTGGRTTIPLPDGTRLFAVTPTALIGSLAAYPNGVSATLFRAIHRQTFQPIWSTSVATTYHHRGFVVAGEGLAQMYLPDGAPEPGYQHLQMRPVDISTGELMAPLASDIYAFEQLSDQQVALYFADTPGGRLVFAGEVLTPFGDLPDVHAQVLDVALSGDTVAVSWQEETVISTTSLDGSGTWSDSHPQPGLELGDNDKELSFGGDVALVDTGVRVGTQNRYRVSWPDGQRDFQASYAILGHGGTYLQRFAYGTAGTTEIVEAKSGEVVRTYSGVRYGVIDGTTSWRPAVNGVMTGTDLLSGTEQEVTLPAGCSTAGIYDVRGRWAQVDCDGGYRIINLDRPSQVVAAPGSAVSHYLGDGFTVAVRSNEPGGPLYANVTSLINGRTMTYGPVRGRYSPPSVGLAVNDDEHPAFVYIDPSYQVRRVNLGWLAEPPPMIQSISKPTLGGSPRVGVRLTATAGTWMPTPTGLGFQWLVDGLPVPGATATSFVPSASHHLKRVSVRVTATREDSPPNSVVSTSSAVRAGTISIRTRPTILGTARVGNRLAASPGTWNPGGLRYSYQWLRNGRVVRGATGRTYLLPRSARGYAYAVRVTARRSGYVSAVQTSRPSSKVR